MNYIKVRPYVAQKLGVEAARSRYPDGNVLLWDKELRRVDVGWVFHPEETVARIGGLMMDPYRNREEQQKTAEECTPLPWPTDPEWCEPESAVETEEAPDTDFALRAQHSEEAAEDGTGDNTDDDAEAGGEEGGEA